MIQQYTDNELANLPDLSGLGVNAQKFDEMLWLSPQSENVVDRRTNDPEGKALQAEIDDFWKQVGLDKKGDLPVLTGHQKTQIEGIANRYDVKLNEEWWARSEKLAREDPKFMKNLRALSKKDIK